MSEASSLGWVIFKIDLVTIKLRVISIGPIRIYPNRAESKFPFLLLKKDKFYVDHDEPLAALKIFNASGKWSLCELLEGHDFLIILPV